MACPRFAFTWAFGALVLSAPLAVAANLPSQLPLCASCHGQQGVSVSPNIPNLAGQKEGYLVNALSAYKANQRHGGMADMMTPIAAQLSPADIQALAAYYSSLKGS